jgi:hypothetical protein
VICADAESVAALAAVVVRVIVVAPEETPVRAGADVPAEIADTSESAAEAGATEVKTPRPKAATATSAMRLKVVFVDICFLSISRTLEFPGLGFG